MEEQMSQGTIIKIPMITFLNITVIIYMHLGNHGMLIKIGIKQYFSLLLK